MSVGPLSGRRSSGSAGLSAQSSCSDQVTKAVPRQMRSRRPRSEGKGGEG